MSTGFAPPNMALLPDTCPASSSGLERGCSFNRGRSFGAPDGGGLLKDVSRSPEESVTNTLYHMTETVLPHSIYYCLASSALTVTFSLNILLL